jgi:hypothetical protein
MASLQLAVVALDRRQATDRLTISVMCSLITHVLDHFALLGSDIVGLLDPDAIDVLLMLSSVESSQLATLNSFVFVI